MNFITCMFYTTAILKIKNHAVSLIAIYISVDGKRGNKKKLRVVSYTAISVPGRHG